MEEVRHPQTPRWAFGSFFVPFWLPKLIAVDADGIFAGMYKKTFQKTLIIRVHAVARSNHNAIRNEGFHRYLENVQKINLADKSILHQWLQGVLFSLYAWNTGPVDGTDNDRSVVAIGR